MRELNGSLSRKEDIAALEGTLHTKSVMHNHRCVLIDEIDGVTIGGQNALRAMMETNVQGISWIFTANDRSKIIPAIQSRMIGMNFSVAEGDERARHVEGMMLRCERILSAEGIGCCDQAELRKVVEWDYPDMRQILNQLQVRFGLTLAA